MKKILLVAVVIILVFSIRSFQNKQNINKQRNEVTAVAQLAIEHKQNSKARAELVELHNKLRVECEKGKAAYNALTEIKATDISSPDCGLIIVR